MLVIAHRGANKEALENSWSAFELAIEAGASRIELDVQLSKDGAAVVCHDDSLLRTTGQRLNISELTRKDLKSIKLNNGEALPMLDEVVERLLPRVELNIEIKGTGEALAAAVAKTIAAHRLRERIIISSFAAPPLRWLARHAPEVRRACLWSSDTFHWPFFANLAPQVFLEWARTNILHPHVDLVDDNLMDQAGARGWLVYAWAPMVYEDDDREGLWTQLKTYGLHGLCTNYPRQLNSWLKDASIDEQSYGQPG